MRACCVSPCRPAREAFHGEDRRPAPHTHLPALQSRYPHPSPTGRPPTAAGVGAERGRGRGHNTPIPAAKGRGGFRLLCPRALGPPASVAAAARLPRSRRQAPAKTWLRFLGYLSSLVDVLPDCRLLMRPLRLFFLRNYRPGRDPLSRRVPLPPTIRLLFGGGAAQNSCARATH